MANSVFTKVTIKNEEYIIQKFDAKTGLKLARLVMAKARPLIPLLAAQDQQDKKKGGKKDGAGSDVYGAIFAILGELKDEDIDALVDKCLRFCYIDLPAGRTPIIDETGNYAVDGVEYDPFLTVMLCYEAIKWGASDFFGENSSLSSLF